MKKEKVTVTYKIGITEEEVIPEDFEIIAGLSIISINLEINKQNYKTVMNYLNQIQPALV